MIRTLLGTTTTEPVFERGAEAIGFSPLRKPLSDHFPPGRTLTRRCSVASWRCVPGTLRWPRGL